uniref:Uncharacterized protein n=1 Tax=Streptomyces auratus AGR0001 TaxID=1160718 RepID=J2A0V8_9ACTN
MQGGQAVGEEAGRAGEVRRETDGQGTGALLRGRPVVEPVRDGRGECRDLPLGEEHPAAAAGGAEVELRRA